MLGRRKLWLTTFVQPKENHEIADGVRGLLLDFQDVFPVPLRVSLLAPRKI